MKNSILNVVHQTATGLRKSEAITDATMSEFDKLCMQHLAQSESDIQKTGLLNKKKYLIHFVRLCLRNKPSQRARITIALIGKSNERTS